MSFNFSAFMNAVSALLPMVGQTVETLHASNPDEKAKIDAGTALIQGMVTALQQMHQPDQPPQG